MKKQNHIRKLRRAIDGMTIEKLAGITGISTTHLSRMERGERGLSLASAVKIARALGVAVHEVDESVSSLLTVREDQETSLEQELIEVLPKLSRSSQLSLLQSARRFQELEEGASPE